jgi:hypothetical protein
MSQSKWSEKEAEGDVGNEHVDFDAAAYRASIEHGISNRSIFTGGQFEYMMCMIMPLLDNCDCHRVFICISASESMNMHCKLQ